MQEIEAKRKLRASEGAHFFFTLIFLTGSAIIKIERSEENCGHLDLALFINLIFYGLIICRRLKNLIFSFILKQ